MKQLSTYRISKYKEIYYIQEFIVGVSKERFQDMFRNKLLEGFFTIQLATRLLKQINPLLKK